MLQMRRVIPFRVPILMAALLAACGCAADGVDVFPLYRDVGTEQKGEFSVLWPLSDSQWNQEDQTSNGWAFPFYVAWEDQKHGSEGLLVPMIPIYMHTRTRETEVLQILPVYNRTQEGALVTRTYLLFLADWSRFEGEEDLQGVSVFPLFQWKRQGPGRRLSLIRFGELFPTGPLFSAFDTDTTELSFQKDEDHVAHSVDLLHAVGRLVQFYHHDDAGSHDDTRILTLFASEPISLYQSRTPHPGAPGADGGRTVLFPFYWNLYDAKEHTRWFWPFYGSTTRGENVTMRSFFFPLTRFMDDEEADTGGFDVVWPLIGARRAGDASHSWFFPLFDKTTAKDGSSFHVLLWMFGRESKGDKSRYRVFWIPFGDELEPPATESANDVPAPARRR